jgi:hypothetical protein
MGNSSKSNNLILREKRISGCDSILLTEPLKTYTEDLVPVEVNLSDYEQVDESKDYVIYKPKK